MSIYTLNEINEIIYNLQQLIQDGADLETIQAFMDTKEMIEIERDVKLEGYAMVIKNLENENAGLKAEKDRFDKRIKTNTNAIENMKYRMTETLQMVEPDKDGKKRVKTEKFTFSFRSSSTVDVDESKVSRFYLKPKYEVDKTAIKKILANGGTVIGARLIENQSLQIK